MKNSFTLKSLNDLPPDAVQFKRATVPATRESSPRPADLVETHEDIREMLRCRQSTPFPIGFSYRHWGINE